MSILDKNCKIGVAVGLTLCFATLGQADDSPRHDKVVVAVGQVMPSVVNIATKTRVQRVRYYYDWWRDNWAPYAQELPPEESAGSGVVVDSSGYVLTNVHVVKDADEIWVKISDGSGEANLYRAEAVAGSLATDIALLKIIPKNTGEHFTAAAFAGDDDLLLGETVLALGNPFGLGGSVSRGILSSKSRRAKSGGSKLDIPDWLQTDASINPGNSGGPLINLDGEIIGINVAVLREGQGIGFAIPIKRVNESLARIFTPEFLEGNWFGAAIHPGSRPLTVASVEPDSPAAKAGLLPGDRVETINQHPPGSFMEFASRLLNLGRDRTVSLQVEREGKLVNSRVTLIPESAYFNAGLIREKTGATLEELTPEVARALGHNSTEGLVVSQVDDDSPAGVAGLTTGVVVLAVDGQEVSDIVSAARCLHGCKEGAQVKLDVLQVRRSGLFLRRRTARFTLQLR
ncbi:MAG: trypsin-like peptidase domain-containing protein [Verrucomicrobiota bacterium]|jgi:S1-C subfamily serine protease|nr:trypsin-like peptidase domain-containing protein [Verrucomicrobiota bacterium]